MAAESRTADYSVEHLLFEEAFHFDFFQAVRLLERIYPDREPIGREANPGKEIVRFGALLSMGFPASAVHQLRGAENGEPDRMTVAFMGLTGPLGVLPAHYTELLIERVRNKDTALRDFLDLFNHRLISIFYRAWEKYHFPIAFERELLRGKGLDRFSQNLFDLIGMGTGGLRRRLGIRDEGLLLYAALVSQQPHSATALEELLSDYFGFPIRTVQFVGEWLLLAEDSRTRLGAANSVLGVSAIAGSRVWDQQARFRVRIGPLRLVDFGRFIPSGDAFAPLVELVRFFVGRSLAFDVQPVLRRDQVPGCRLGDTGPGAPRLGWTTWLKDRPFKDDADDLIVPDDQVVPRPSSTADASGALRERVAA